MHTIKKKILALLLLLSFVVVPVHAENELSDEQTAETETNEAVQQESAETETETEVKKRNPYAEKYLTDLEYFNDIYLFDMDLNTGKGGMSEQYGEVDMYERALIDLGIIKTTEGMTYAHGAPATGMLLSDVLAALRGMTDYPLSYAQNDDTQITLDIAVMELLDAMGYNGLMKLEGASVTRYMQEAFEEEFLEGLSGDAQTPITSTDIARLIYNSLDKEIIEVANYGDTPVEYKKRKGVTMIGKYLNIYPVEGCVTATPDINIYSSACPAEGSVHISQFEFLVGETAAYDYFGSVIKAYYKSDKNGDDTLLTVIPDDKGQAKTFMLSDFVNLTANKVEWEVVDAEGNVVEQSLNISALNKYIYNGQPDLNGQMVNDALFEKEGKVTYADSDNDGEYDTMVMYVYDSFVINSIDVARDRVYLKNNSQFNSKNYIDLDDDISILKNGAYITLAELSRGNIISVLANGSNIRSIIVSDKKVKGTITAKTGDVYTIDGKDYKVSKSYKDAVAAQVNGVLVVEPGLNATFSVSEFGFITDIASSSNAYTTAYLRIALMDDNDESVSLQLFSENALWNNLKLADKVVVNKGTTKLSPMVVYNKIKSEGAEKKLVKYKTNNSDEIVDIIFAKNAPAGTESAKGDEVLNFGNYQGTIDWTMGWKLAGSNYKLASDTLFFCIPTDERDYNKYSIMDKNSYIKDGMPLNIALYNIDDLSLVKYAVCGASDTGMLHNTVMVVESVSTVIDSNEELCYNIKGVSTHLTHINYGTTTPVEYNSTNEFYKNHPGLKSGDVIRYSLTGDNKFSNMTLVYSVPETDPGDFETINGNVQLNFGTVEGTKPGARVVGVRINGTKQSFLASAVLIYYKDTETIQVATVADLYDGDRVLCDSDYNEKVTRLVLAIR